MVDILDTLRGARKAAQRRLLFTAAKIHRRRLRATTFVGVTGSTGKTMTKELVAHVLSLAGACTATPQGRNLRTQLARTVLQTRPHHRYCVLEVATLTPGYMAPHVDLVRPDIAIVTNIGRDHWRAFGSMEAIASEKETLVKALRDGGLAILNADDPLVFAMASRCRPRVITYGAAEHADVRVVNAHSAWPEPLALTVQVGSTVVEVRTQLFGTHWQSAVLAAMAVAVGVGIDLDEAAAAIGNVRPPSGRMSVEVHPDGVTFVRDDIKASPPSVDAALAFLSNVSASRKVAVLGTLSDVPAGEAKRVYARVARAALDVADLVFFVGSQSSMALRARSPETAHRLSSFATVRELKEHLDQTLTRNDLVLLKGSLAADHLMRLAIARTQTVECWRENCRRIIQCSECDLLSTPHRHPHEASSPSQTIARSAAPSEPAVFVPLVVGLGNPGREYVGTPHNTGHAVLDELARRLGVQWTEGEDVSVAEALHDERPLVLLKLLVPINRSGEALRRYLERATAAPYDCILVHDDMDLRLGAVKVRRRGSSGGHRGVASILTEFQTVDIRRVKVGVAARDGRKLTPDELLTPFPPEDDAVVRDAIHTAADKVLQEVVDYYRTPRPEWLLS